MINLITLCTCSLLSQYGSRSAYLCCENKEIDQDIYIHIIEEEIKILYLILY